ncbi:MAG: hypothetical protein AAF733_02030 [Verrucomicrobiota bacterium]
MAICLGEIAEKVVKTWSEVTDCYLASDLKDAVAKASQFARRGEVVLFSPGTSSFDMFRGYEERGDAFREVVSVLAAL